MPSQALQVSRCQSLGACPAVLVLTEPRNDSTARELLCVPSFQSHEWPRPAQDGLRLLEVLPYHARMSSLQGSLVPRSSSVNQIHPPTHPQQQQRLVARFFLIRTKGRHKGGPCYHGRWFGSQAPKQQDSEVSEATQRWAEGRI